MRLHDLADDKLLANTSILVKQEREVTLEILHHLREIEKRRLFSTLKCQSLFDYCTQHLKYSESQALRRISAMRALRDLPEIESRIENGSLSLANVAQAQSFFNQERKEDRPLSRDEKIQVMGKLENQSKRNAEKIIAVEKSSRSAFPGYLLSVKVFNIEMTSEYEEVLTKLKGLLAHKMPNATSQEIILAAMKIAVAQLDPQKTKPRKNQSLKVLVWQKHQGKCEICRSTHALQVDHIIPRAHGGKDELSNLRLLCRNCNQRQAIEKIGKAQMLKYLTSDNVKTHRSHIHSSQISLHR